LTVGAELSGWWLSRVAQAQHMQHTSPPERHEISSGPQVQTLVVDDATLATLDAVSLAVTDVVATCLWEFETGRRTTETRVAPPGA